MILAVLVLITGLVIFGVILLARYLEVLSWQRSLVAYRLKLPSELSVEDVTRWLTGIAASTHPMRFSLLPLPPVVVEIVSSSKGGIAHYVLVTKLAEAKLLSGL